MKNRISAVRQEIILFAPIRIDRWYQSFCRPNAVFLHPSLVNINRASAAGKKSNHSSQRFQERRCPQEMGINIKGKSILRLRLETGDEQILSWRNAELSQQFVQHRCFGSAVQEGQKATTFLPISMEESGVLIM